MPRLHKSSWIVGAVTALLCALIILPGETVPIYPANRPTYSHGWPLEFLLRDVDNTPVFQGDDGKIYVMLANFVMIDSPPHRAPWTVLKSWQLWRATEAQWNMWGLATDALGACTIVASAVVLWEWRRRHRANAVQFRLGELLGAMVLLAIVLGYVQYLNSIHDKEQHLCDAIGEYNVYPNDECDAPRWLRRLTGTSILPRGFDRVRELDLTIDDLKTHKELASLLARLNCVRAVNLDGPVFDVSEAFDVLTTLKSLRTLDLRNYKMDTVDFSERDLASLSRLRQITELHFDEIDEIKPESLAAIRAALPQCRILFD